MTPERRAELKRLAEAAPQPHMVKVTVEAESWADWSAAGAFMRAANPAAVLDLLAEVDSSALALEEWRKLHDEAMSRAAEAERSKDFYAQWYAERFERLRQMAKERGFWPEMAAIIANGTASVDEPPTYAQQLNMAKHRAEAAESKLAAVESAVAATAGGSVEGAATTPANYLQRIRELVATEQERDALRAEVERWKAVAGERAEKIQRERRSTDAEVESLRAEVERLKAALSAAEAAWEDLHKQRAEEILSRDEEISSLKAQIAEMGDDARHAGYDRDLAE